MNFIRVSTLFEYQYRLWPESTEVVILISIFYSHGLTIHHGFILGLFIQWNEVTPWCYFIPISRRVVLYMHGLKLYAAV